MSGAVRPNPCPQPPHVVLAHRMISDLCPVLHPGQQLQPRRDGQPLRPAVRPRPCRPVAVHECVSPCRFFGEHPHRGLDEVHDRIDPPDMLKIQQNTECPVDIQQDVRQVHVQVRDRWAHDRRHLVGQAAQQADSGLNQGQRSIVESLIGLRSHAPRPATTSLHEAGPTPIPATGSPKLTTGT